MQMVKANYRYENGCSVNSLVIGTERKKDSMTSAFSLFKHMLKRGSQHS